MPGDWCDHCDLRVDCLTLDTVTDCEVTDLLEDMQVHLRDPEIIIAETGLIIAVNLKTFQAITKKFPNVQVRKNLQIRHRHNPEGLEAHWGDDKLTVMFVIMEKEVL